MDPVSLRIKFSPIIKNIPSSNTKCCIEIIPEVSDLRNIEKVNWKLEENIIEYTVPMVYKIFIKKGEDKKYLDHELQKTYHSCVDLVQDDSMFQFNLGSGDIMRTLSDNAIRHKYSTIDNVDNLIQDVSSPQKEASFRSNIASTVKVLDMLGKQVMFNENQFQKSKILNNEIVYNDETNSHKVASQKLITGPHTCSPITTPTRRLSKYTLSLSCTKTNLITASISKNSEMKEEEGESDTKAKDAVRVISEIFAENPIFKHSSNDLENKTTFNPLSTENSVASTKQSDQARSCIACNQNLGSDHGQYIPVTPKVSTENIQECPIYKDQLKDLYESWAEFFKHYRYYGVHYNKFQAIASDTKISTKSIRDDDNHKETLALQECLIDNGYHDIDNKNVESVIDATKRSCENMLNGEVNQNQLNVLHDSNALLESANYKCHRDIGVINFHTNTEHPVNSIKNNGNEKCIQNFNGTEDLQNGFEDNCYKVIYTNVEDAKRSVENIGHSNIYKEELEDLYDSKALRKFLKDNCNGISNNNCRSTDVKPTGTTKHTRESDNYRERNKNLHETNTVHECFKDNCYHASHKNNCKFLVLLLRGGRNINSKTILTNTASLQKPFEKNNDGGIDKEVVKADPESLVKVKGPDKTCASDTCKRVPCAAFKFVPDAITSKNVPNKIYRTVAVPHTYVLGNCNKCLKQAFKETIPPEIRVASFVSQLEFDFGVLKIKLNDLYNKCTSMGILKKQNSLCEKSPNSLSNNDKSLTKCSSNNSNNSNRVVYTMSFQE